jgi:hypothetical protein
LFPYRIEFQKLEGQNTNQMVTLEIVEPQKARDIPDEWFQVNDGLHEPIDRTAFYFDRFQTLSQESKRR